jgi:hypothetical protein
LADALIDGVRRNSELARDFLGRKMLVDKTETVQLSGGQPTDSLLDILVGPNAVWPPIAVRQAVSILPSDFRPAQHLRNPPSTESGGSYDIPRAFARFSADLRDFSDNLS